MKELVFIFLLFSTGVWANSISVDVDPIRLGFEKDQVISPGTKIVAMDSIDMLELQGADIGEWMSLQAAFYVKSYAAGGIATPTFRGGSAAQTSVLWGGRGINSAMSGVSDLSLIPVSFFPSATVEFGGAGAERGNAAIAGAINLKDSSVIRERIHLGSRIGSFGERSHWLNAGISKKGLNFKTKFFFRNAENDFYFWKEQAGELDTLVQMTHAQVENSAISTALSKSFEKGFWEAKVWYQNSERAIPPTKQEAASQAVQFDKNLNALLRARIKRKHSTLGFNARYLNKRIDYNNPLSDIQAENQVQQWDASLTQTWSKDSLTLFKQSLLAQLNHANSTSYNANVFDPQFSYFFTFRYQLLKDFSLQLSARELYALDQFQIPSFDAAFNYQISPYIKSFAKFSRVFRVPTLNDRYWDPGGNLDLIPENGYAQDLGVQVLLKYAKVQIDHKSTFYHKLINNWIAWSPNGGFWTAQNLKKARSYGLETDSKLHYTQRKYGVGFAINTSYTIAEVVESDVFNDAAIGKQMIYTPMYRGVGKVFVKYQCTESVKVLMNYRHSYTGYRYTSSDNLHYLKPYDLGTVLIALSYHSKSYQFGLSMQANNIWGATYELVQSRPTPLTKYGLTLTFKYI